MNMLYTPDNIDIDKKRFFYLDFGEELEKEYEWRREREHLDYMGKIIQKGICTFCGSDHNPWFDDSIHGGGEFVCYQCFYKNLSFCAEVAVPMTNARSMRDFVEEYEWDVRRIDEMTSFIIKDLTFHGF